MALKRVTAPIASSKKSSKEPMPSFSVPGDVVTRFNRASAEAKEAAAVLEQTNKELKELGLTHFLSTVCGGSTTPSIVLIDDNRAEARYTFQNRYSAADAAQVEAVFENIERDVNDWVIETVKCSFDQKFFTNDNGFDQALYDEMVVAVGKVAAKHKKENPLSMKKVVLPKDEFHAKRFTEFSAEDNRTLCSVLPNTVTLTPVSAKIEG